MSMCDFNDYEITSKGECPWVFKDMFDHKMRNTRRKRFKRKLKSKNKNNKDITFYINIKE